MDVIGKFIESLKYYRAVAHIEFDAEILKAELRNLIAEAHIFAEDVRSTPSKDTNCEHEWVPVASIKCEECGLLIED